MIVARVGVCVQFSRIERANKINAMAIFMSAAGGKFLKKFVLGNRGRGTSYLKRGQFLSLSLKKNATRDLFDIKKDKSSTH